MEPDRDVKILQMGGQPQIVAGMVAGAVQGRGAVVAGQL
jgi:hypothetical protein